MKAVADTGGVTGIFIMPYLAKGKQPTANDLNTPARFVTLGNLLLARGHSEARVEKIMGANLFRLFSETWV